MDLLELDRQGVHRRGVARVRADRRAAHAPRRAQGARRRADDLWGARTAIAARVVGVTLDELLAGDDSDWQICEDLALLAAVRASAKGCAPMRPHSTSRGPRHHHPEEGTNTMTATHPEPKDLGTTGI